MTPTASILDLALLCNWWTDPAVQPPAMPTSDEARVGTALHSCVQHGGERDVSGFEPEELATVRRWHAAWQMSDWSRWPWQHEVAFAYDPAADAGRILPSDSHRDYSDAKPGEITGTADLVLCDGDRVVVADIKTGAQMTRKPARDAMQLRFLALAASRVWGVSEAHVMFLDVDDDGVLPESADLDADDLLDTRMALLSVLQPSAPRPGDHCTGCKAVAVCPDAARKQEALVALEAPVALTDAVLPDVLAGLAIARKRLEALNDWARDRVAQLGEVRLPDGRVARMAPEERSSISAGGDAGAKAAEVLARYGVPVKVKASASWEDVDEALKAKGLVGRGKAKEREQTKAAIRSELAALGALSTGESVKLKITKE